MRPVSNLVEALQALMEIDFAPLNKRKLMLKQILQTFKELLLSEHLGQYIEGLTADPMAPEAGFEASVKVMAVLQRGHDRLLNLYSTVHLPTPGDFRNALRHVEFADILGELAYPPANLLPKDTPQREVVLKLRSIYLPLLITRSFNPRHRPPAGVPKLD